MSNCIWNGNDPRAPQPIVPNVPAIPPASEDCDFATVYHAATVKAAPWPVAVAAWGAQSEANAHLLKTLKEEGSPHGDRATRLRLIDVVIVAVHQFVATAD